MIWIKFFVTLSLLIGLLIQSNLSQLVETLRQVSWPALVLAGLLVYGALIVNALKWHLLLKHYRVFELFKLNLIATYYSTLLPGQIFGEVVKAYRLGRGQQDAEMIAASVAVDKMTGLIGVLLVGLGGLYMTSSVHSSILMWIFLALTFLLTLLLFFAQLLEMPLKVLLSKRFSRVMTSVEHLLSAWRTYLQSPQVLFSSLVLGIIFQLLCVGIVKVLAQSLHIPLAWNDACWIFAVVSLAVFLPLSLAGIGIREGAFVGTLHLLGISSGQALALSFSLFSFNLLTALIGGLIELQSLRKNHP